MSRLTPNQQTENNRLLFARILDAIQSIINLQDFFREKLEHAALEQAQEVSKAKKESVAVDLPNVQLTGPQPTKNTFESFLRSLVSGYMLKIETLQVQLLNLVMQAVKSGQLSQPAGQAVTQAVKQVYNSGNMLMRLQKYYAHRAQNPTAPILVEDDPNLLDMTPEFRETNVKLQKEMSQKPQNTREHHESVIRAMACRQMSLLLSSNSNLKEEDRVQVASFVSSAEHLSFAGIFARNTVNTVHSSMQFEGTNISFTMLQNTTNLLKVGIFPLPATYGCRLEDLEQQQTYVPRAIMVGNRS